MRVGSLVGPGGTWGEGGALSGAREHLGRVRVEWGRQWGLGAAGGQLRP